MKELIGKKVRVGPLVHRIYRTYNVEGTIWLHFECDLIALNTEYTEKDEVDVNCMACAVMTLSRSNL